MNINLLETLVAVDEQGSIAGAARLLNVSAAAVAERIKLLESDIDAPVIQRRGRTVELTEAGLLVLPYAQQILYEVAELRRHAHPAEVQGRLRVGAVSSALGSLFPGVLERLPSRLPKVDVQVMPGTANFLSERLTEDQIDCAVIAKPQYALGKAFRWDHLRWEPLVLLTRWSDPVLPINEVLKSYPVIGLDPATRAGQTVQRYFADNGLKPTIIMELDAYEAFYKLIARGVGVALLTDAGMPGGPEIGVRKTPIDGSAYGREVGVLSKYTSGRRSLVDSLIQLLQEEVALEAAQLANHQFS